MPGLGDTDISDRTPVKVISPPKFWESVYTRVESGTGETHSACGSWVRKDQEFRKFGPGNYRPG